MSGYRRFSRTKAAVAATFAVVLVAAAQPTLSTTVVPRPRLVVSKPSYANSMGFVPPHLLRKIADNPQNSESERARAQSTLDHDGKVAEESLDHSRLSRAPLEALQRLADDSSISYSDKVEEELQAILDPARSRWPYMPDVPVSRELKGVLTTNGLWKDPDEQTVKDKSKGETRDNRDAGNEDQKKHDQQK